MEISVHSIGILQLHNLMMLIMLPIPMQFGTQQGVTVWSNLDKRKLVSGISKTTGYRDGDAANALFGKLTSVVYFKMNEQLVQQELNKKVVILTNNSTTCLTTTIDNY